MMTEEMSEESIEDAIIAIQKIIASMVEKPTGKPTKVIVQPALLAQRGYTVEDVSKMIEGVSKIVRERTHMNEPFENVGFYTAGPWRHNAGNHGEFLISSESYGFAPLARVRGDKRSTLKAAKANACLMAAAPDLLTALYAMMEHCYDPDRDDDIVKAFDLARNAIAKAEGFK